MGPGLEERSGAELDTLFTTARLWGVADSAPYMHDGRALTLREAILMHGGEGREARDAFASARQEEQMAMIRFLKSLRIPIEEAQSHAERLVKKLRKDERKRSYRLHHREDRD